MWFVRHALTRPNLLLIIPLLFCISNRAEGKSAELSEQAEECLECHEDPDDDEVLTFGDGSSLKVTVDPEKWLKSTHAEELKCTDCHREISDYPHPEIRFRSVRTYQIERSATCRRCHYAHYTRILDGIHYEQLEQGNEQAPTCVDCHGAHDTENPSHPKLNVSKRCASCHAEIASTYDKSVHGRSLANSNAEDAPACTDCHGAHGIRDPRKPSFHASSHAICARCHGDAERMKPYDLSPHVVKTYLDDFHGRSNELYSLGAGKPGRPMATCTDCHGFHDVQTLKGETQQAAMKARVVKVCRECHSDDELPASFAGAWLSHYEPSPTSAPLVWGIRWIYRIMIPVIVAGLILHILLHLWKMRSISNEEEGRSHASS